MRIGNLKGNADSGNPNALMILSEQASKCALWFRFGKVLALAISVIATTSFADVTDEEYRFIISGDPVAAANAGAHFITSNEDASLDALCMSERVTSGGSLNSTKAGIIIMFR